MCTLGQRWVRKEESGRKTRRGKIDNKAKVVGEGRRCEVVEIFIGKHFYLVM